MPKLWRSSSPSQQPRPRCAAAQRQGGTEAPVHWADSVYWPTPFIKQLSPRLTVARRRPTPVWRLPTVHKTSIKNRPKPGAKSSNSTELSNHTWELKDKKIDYTISWKIIDRAQPFNPSTKMCRLCLIEKYHLMYNQQGATLNNRSEFYSACRHKKRKLISNGWLVPFLLCFANPWLWCSIAIVS